MKPRYTKRVREEAALICAIAASSNRTVLYHEVTRETGAPGPAYELAYRAYGATYGMPADESEHPSCVRDAEAEALIRSGFPFDGDE